MNEQHNFARLYQPATKLRLKFGCRWIALLTAWPLPMPSLHSCSGMQTMKDSPTKRKDDGNAKAALSANRRTVWFMLCGEAALLRLRPTDWLADQCLNRTKCGVKELAGSGSSNDSGGEKRSSDNGGVVKWRYEWIRTKGSWLLASIDTVWRCKVRGKEFEDVKRTQYFF